MDKQMKKNMIWNAVGSLTYLAAQWVITVLTARIYGYADAGILSLAMSITAAFQTIALFGIRNFQVSDIENKYADNCYVMLRNLTSVIALVLCVGFAFINSYGFEQIIAIIWFMLFRLAEDYSDVLYGIDQKNGRLDLAGQGFLIKGISTLLAFLLFYYIGAGMNTAILSMAVTSWISTILFDLVISQRSFHFQMSDKIRNSFVLAKETAPLCAYLFLSAAVTVIPKYILEKMTDETVLGVYSSIFAPAVILHAASIYIYTPFVNKLAELNSGRKHKEFLGIVYKICLAVTAFGLLAIIAAVFLGDLALEFVYGSSILEYSYMLIPTLAATITIALASFAYMLEVVIRDFKNLIIGCVIGCVAAVAFTPVMINIMGANGTNFGIIICEILSVAYMMISVIRKVRRPVE